MVVKFLKSECMAFTEVDYCKMTYWHFVDSSVVKLHCCFMGEDRMLHSMQLLKHNTFSHCLIHKTSFKRFD